MTGSRGCPNSSPHFLCRFPALFSHYLTFSPLNVTLVDWATTRGGGASCLPPVTPSVASATIGIVAPPLSGCQFEILGCWIYPSNPNLLLLAALPGRVG